MNEEENGRLEDDILTIKILRPKNGETDVRISYEVGFLLFLKKDNKMREVFLNYLFTHLNKYIDEIDEESKMVYLGAENDR